MKIITIVGARPQFVKTAIVSHGFKKHNKIEELIIHTGQHYDTCMSDFFFQELSIPAPTYNLQIGSDSHGAQTAKMLEAIDKILHKEKPDWVLVYGDTNSTLAGALAAAKLHIPIAHVEAGLRSFNRKMPEEINRVLTDHLSEILFTPTKTAIDNLATEGINPSKIQHVGDVMYDAALQYSKYAEKQSQMLTKLKLSTNNYILTTIHRAENTDSRDRLTIIIHALNKISLKLPVILPLHPRTYSMLKKFSLLDKLKKQIIRIEPVSFLDMVMLEKNARLIITDSGGVQKEAFFHKIPCVTIRDETEWVELVDLGWNVIAPPTSTKSLYEALIQALQNHPEKHESPYGDGNAAQLICDYFINL